MGRGEVGGGMGREEEQQWSGEGSEERGGRCKGAGGREEEAERKMGGGGRGRRKEGVIGVSPAQITGQSADLYAISYTRLLK